jgi:hypothetical protein
MIDVDVLIEVYQTLKEYIPSKDRQAAADHFTSVVCDYDITDNDIKALAGVDSYMKRAIEEYIGEEVESDDEEDDEDY